ncbi:MAG: hypothetical protein WDW38_008824 [Sanguina aurantia]
MLRIARSFWQVSGISTQSFLLPCASFSVGATSDYALVQKQATEVGVSIPLPPKEAGYAAGIPLDTYNRLARIYVPARSSSQSGLAKGTHNSLAAPVWKIEFDTQAKWENPLTGWSSTSDPLENIGRTTLFFFTKEEAMSFCDKHGWKHTVEEPNARRTMRQKRYAQYGDNFSTLKRRGVPDLSTLPSNLPATETETAAAEK